MIFGQSQQHRVIDDAAMLIGDQNIFGLTNGHFRQIARRHILHKTRGIGAGNLNLPLNRHITQDGGSCQVPEIFNRVAKIARDVHMVIDGIAGCAPVLGCCKEG